MTPETPLPEVAALLPRTAAALLSGSSSDVQVRVLGCVRTCFVYWEEQGYDIDPITLEGVLNGLVAMAAGMGDLIERLCVEILDLKRALAMVELRGAGGQDD